MTVAKTRELSSWQAQKSAATRNLVIDATIRCLGELGYRRTTTQAIAAEAGLSRGALLHHFSVKADAIHASVEALYRHRLQLLVRTLGRRVPAGADRPTAVLQALSQSLRDRTFCAALELGIAARTDRRLAQLLAPAEKAYGREWRRLTRSALTASAESGAAAELPVDASDAALDAARAALEGLAFVAAFSDDSSSFAPVLQALERVLRPMLRTSAAE